MRGQEVAAACGLDAPGPLAATCGRSVATASRTAATARGTAATSQF